MPFEVPVTNQSNAIFNVILNSVGYSMRTYWQEEARMWFLDMSLNDDTNVAMGLALVPNINILRFSRELTTDIGELRIVDNTGEGNANITTLGNSSILIYFEPGEFETLYPDFGTVDFRAQQFDFDDLFTVES